MRVQTFVPSRQLKRNRVTRLVRGVVQFFKRSAIAIDYSIQNGRALPPSVERAMFRGLFIWVGICVVIWTAVYFQHHIQWVNP